MGCKGDEMKVPGSNVNRQERTLECAVSRKYQRGACPKPGSFNFMISNLSPSYAGPSAPP